MRRPLLLVLVSALLALGLLAGCGGDDGDNDGGGDDAAELKKEFDRGYRPINDEFVALGNQVGETINAAEDTKRADFARKFDSFAEQVGRLRGRLDALEPPPDYEADAKRLSAAMGLVEDDLSEISRLATAEEAKALRAEVQELARHSVEVRTARRALARKTGAKVSS